MNKNSWLKAIGVYLLCPMMMLSMDVGPTLHEHLCAETGTDNKLIFDTASRQINLPLLAGLGAATVSGFTIGHIALNNLWWKGQRTDFFVNTKQDYCYALNADKAGHATFAYITSTAYQKAIVGCGVDSGTAVWTGFGVSMAYQAYIEVRDGFSATYGFSWGDVAANVIGASLPVLHHYIPATKAASLQISFWPSQAYKQGAFNTIIDDYMSTTHWVAVDIAAVWDRWPIPWLGVAVGHSVDNLDGIGGGYHRWFLAADWRLFALPGLPKWLESALQLFHVYHIPAPAIEFHQKDGIRLGIRF
jgi:hypothetical protein